MPDGFDATPFRVLRAVAQAALVWLLQVVSPSLVVARASIDWSSIGRFVRRALLDDDEAFVDEFGGTVSGRRNDSSIAMLSDVIFEGLIPEEAFQDGTGMAATLRK